MTCEHEKVTIIDNRPSINSHWRKYLGGREVYMCDDCGALVDCNNDLTMSANDVADWIDIIVETRINQIIDAAESAK